MSRPCGCIEQCRPGATSLLHPGIVWADIVREIEQETADPYGTGDIVPADLWGRREEAQ